MRQGKVQPFKVTTGWYGTDSDGNGDMVAAGYGTTLIPGLAAGAAQDAGIVLRPLAARAGRMVRIAWRASFPRRAAAEAVGEVIAGRLRGFAAGAAAGSV